MLSDKSLLRSSWVGAFQVCHGGIGGSARVIGQQATKHAVIESVHGVFSSTLAAARR
jgi:hypothetical protein